MSSISHKTVDSIMHIFNTVVSAASTVSVSRITEWGIVGLLGDELVCKDSKAVFFGLQSATRRSGHLACWVLSHVRWTIGYQLPVDQRRLTVSKDVWVSYSMREVGELCVFNKILSYRGGQRKRKKEKRKRKNIVSISKVL